MINQTRPVSTWPARETFAQHWISPTRLARRIVLPFASLLIAIAIAGCSSPADVSEAQRAARETCEALEPLPGVIGASCTVNDGGFDAGVERKTGVEFNNGATAEQIHRVVTTWPSLKDGGSNENAVRGSRATPLLLKLAANTEASFSIAPGTSATGVAFVREWLGHAIKGMQISASAGDVRTIRVAEDGLSPSAQVALLDDFTMQTRSDSLRLVIGTGESATKSASFFEAPISAALGATMQQFDVAYQSLSAAASNPRPALTVDAVRGKSPTLWFRIPAELVPAAPPEQAVTQTPGWPTIRVFLEAAASNGEEYTLGLVARPGDVIGGISTSGCTPDLLGPRPRYGEELQIQWAVIHDVAPSENCKK